MPAVVGDRLVVPTAQGVYTLLASVWDAILPSGAHVHLFVNDVVPTPFTVIGDLLEASFDDYDDVVISGTMGVPDDDSDGSVSAVLDQLMTWAGPTDDSGQVVYGYYVTDSGGTVLQGAYRFETPVSLTTPSDVLTLVIGMRLPAID